MDGYNPRAGFAPAHPKPIPQAEVIQEFLDNLVLPGNRTIIPATKPNGEPTNTPATPFPIPTSPTPPVPLRAPDQVPPAQIPPARPLPGVEPIEPGTDQKFQKRAPFPLSGVESKGAAAGGTAAFAAMNKLIDLTKLPLPGITPTGTPFLTKMIRGGPAGVIATNLSLAPEAGSGEEARINIEQRARVIGAELAAGQIAPLTTAEIAALQAELQSPVAVGAFAQGFNARANENARVLAAGFAVDAARGIVAGDLAAVAGSGAISDRTQFVAQLLGLVVPVRAVGNVNLFNPALTQGDP